MNKPHVVILGGGFGGLASAVHLARQAKRRKQAVTITVIDRNPYQLFTPDLYEMAAATSSIRTDADLRRAVCLDVRAVLQQSGVEFIQDTITGLDRAAQQVLTSSGPVAYDYCVIAVGSESFDFGIPGMQEYALPLKTMDDALAIRQAVLTLIHTSKNGQIIVCGAGAAGVEVAAELSMTCHTTGATFCPQVILVEAGNAILGPFSDKTKAAAKRRLDQLGVRQQTDFRIATVTPTGVESDSGQTIPGTVIVWTGGVRGSSLLTKFDLPLTKRQQIAVQADLRVLADPRLFCIGDAAEFTLADGSTVPMTAHEAVHQAARVADNLLRLIAGNNDLLPYHMHHDGYVITTGAKTGIVELPGGWVLSGFVGWFVRKFVDFRHFRSVLPFTQASSVWIHGVKVGVQNDKTRKDIKNF